MFISIEKKKKKYEIDFTESIQYQFADQKKLCY